MNDDNELRNSVVMALADRTRGDITFGALADAALAGIHEHHAIVRLPEPQKLHSGFLQWRFDRYTAIVWTQPGALVMVQNVEPGDLQPDQARALAAALLAAADAAEREQ